MSSLKTAVPERAAPAFHEIERGMALHKCRKCGCMKEALDAASRTFRHAEEPEIRELLPAIEDYQIAMEPIAYDCIGCKKCWGADAIIQLASSFEEVAPSECVGHNAHSAKREHGCSWPPHAGEYIVGNPAGSVAICTLSNRELPPKLIAVAGADLAIAGRCDTENIGIEKVVLAAKRPTTALSVQSQSGSQTASHVERLQARAAKTLHLDKAGFFVVLPQAATGLIICEHYENSGRLAHVIEGRQAALIAATVIQEGLVTQLDHAAYLGRELAKAEIALQTGSHYEQDAGLGILPSKKSKSTELCDDLACSCHGA
jgi:Tetrahydromethanopterin S-methyltransferase, subunit A/Domain of unknown function (DUF4346)